MQHDSIQDSTRYVVSGLHHGSILPGKREEISRDVYLIANADIRGGIWARQLYIKGPNIRVEESVYASAQISIEGDESNTLDAPVTFLSNVTTPDSLLVKNVTHKARFLADVYAGKLNLSNCIVYGNIYADSGIVHDSIILGGIFCKHKLEIDNSMISTFRANTVTIGKHVYLLFPSALAGEAMRIEHPIKALTFLNLLRDTNDTSIDDGIITIDQRDVIEVDDTTPHLKSDEKPSNEPPKAKKMYCISIVDRLLDIKELEKHFQFNRTFLENLVLSSHIDPSLKEQEFNKPLEELESKLWKILGQKEEFREIKAVSFLADLIKRSDVAEMFRSE